MNVACFLRDKHFEHSSLDRDFYDSVSVIT